MRPQELSNLSMKSKNQLKQSNVMDQYHRERVKSSRRLKLKLESFRDKLPGMFETSTHLLSIIPFPCMAYDQLIAAWQYLSWIKQLENLPHVLL